jgi:excinuclease UvrABC nuclease subunit
MFELESGLSFDPEHDEQFFGALPARPAVFLIELGGAAENGARPYLARTANLQRRLGVLLGRVQEPSRRLNLRELAARVRYRVVGSRFEQALVLYHHAVRIHPGRYRSWMRLRPPVLVKLKLRSAYPRAYVTRRILDDGALYLGPFASRRSADAFLSQALNFFKIRRCQIRIQRDPKFPGCLYSEMKMCLAPCFAGCTDEEYGAEVVRVDSFLRSRGGSLSAELEASRNAASAALDFERSAVVQKKVEKVAATLRLLPELARNLEELDAVVLQRGSSEQSIAVFPVRRGFLEPPLLLEFGSLAAEPRSVEAILRERLEAAGAPELPGGAPGLDRRADHLSVLARWYYSKPRDGEILYADPARREWPYRRIVRACSRLLAGDADSQ